MPKRTLPDDERNEKEGAPVVVRCIGTADKSGIDEIETLFDSKKMKKKESANNKTSKTSNAGSATSKQQQQQKLKYDRSDIAQLKPKEWIEDGLGGKFNKEGFTGRTEQGVNIYKAHLFNKRDFGKTSDCPFDCDCCFI